MDFYIAVEHQFLPGHAWMKNYVNILSRHIKKNKQLSYANSKGQSEPSLVIDMFSPLTTYVILMIILFVCVEVLRPSQPNGVMSSVVSLPNHTFTGQA